MLNFNEYLVENNTLEDIRHFRGTLKQFKDFFDEKARANTNAFNDYDKKYPTEEGEQKETQPVYQTFGIVNVPERNKK